MLNMESNRSLNSMEVEAKKMKLKSSPIHIQMVPSWECNLKCVMCQLAYYKKEKAFNTQDGYLCNVEEYCILQPFLNQASSIHIGGAEPFYYSQFRELLDLIENRQHQIAVTTNGTFLSQDNRELLIKSEKFRRIEISLDSCNKESFERIRSGAIFEDVCEKVRKLSSLKKKHNMKSPEIVIKYVLMKSNMNDLPDQKLYRFIKELDVDALEISIMNLQVPEMKIESVLADEKIASEALMAVGSLRQDFFSQTNVEPKILYDKSYTILKEFLGKNDKPSKPSGATKEICTSPWTALRIWPNGECDVCGQHYIHKPYLLGNFRHDSLEEIWNGERAVNLRKSIVNGTFDYCPPSCKYVSGS